MTHEERIKIPVTWQEGDNVKVGNKLGTVRYVYTNGYTLVQFPNRPIHGGALNNDSTYGNEMIAPHQG
jgi:hypothetical protein